MSTVERSHMATRWRCAGAATPTTSRSAMAHISRSTSTGRSRTSSGPLPHRDGRPVTNGPTDTEVERRALGPFTVLPVGLCAMQLTGPGVFGPPRDHDEAIRLLRGAIDLGVDHIDTAQYYGPDVVNQLIRDAL